MRTNQVHTNYTVKSYLLQQMCDGLTDGLTVINIRRVPAFLYLRMLKRTPASSPPVSFSYLRRNLLAKWVLGFLRWNIERKGAGKENKKMLIGTKIRRFILGGRILRKIAMVYEGNTLGKESMGIFIAIGWGLRVSLRCLRKQKCWLILKLFLATWVL